MRARYDVLSIDARLQPCKGAAANDRADKPKASGHEPRALLTDASVDEAFPGLVFALEGWQSEDRTHGCLIKTMPAAKGG